uniref:Transcription factor zinc-finger domain-containing protein n=1 Tax=Neobacillus citreus TaxID=2833578 RepID=A0A942T0Q6_9BACI
MMHDGWCPDCDLRTVVIDADEQGEHAWATCTECGSGWVHRDDLPEPVVVAVAAPERRAA